MANWGVKISKPGVDVKTADDEDLVMSSSFNTLKIAYVDAPEASGTYSHGLGYSPAFLVAGEGFFVGQEFSAFEVTYGSTSSLFYYYTDCRYWLFYQETD